MGFELIFMTVLLSLYTGEVSAIYQYEWEQKIINQLLRPSSYDKNAVPMKSTKDAVTVEMDLALYKIISMDEQKQTLSANTWIKLEWNDHRLSWNSSEFGGVTEIQLYPERIWRPDIGLYNDVSVDVKYIPEQFVATIRSDGFVSLSQPHITQSYCQLDLRTFPFDTQACYLKYSSWAYKKDRVNLVPSNNNTSGSLAFIMKSSSWDVLKLPVKRHERAYDDSGRFVIPDLTYWIVMKRRSTYYLFNLVMPCICVTFVAILVFSLPPDTGSRISLSITALLSTVVLLHFVANKTPRISKLPLLGVYFGAVMIMMTLSAALSIGVCHIYHLGTSNIRLPRWIRRCFLKWIAVAFFMQSNVKDVLIEAERKSFRKKQQDKMCESNSNNISNEGDSEQKLGKQAKKEPETFSVSFNAHENEATMTGQEVRVQETIEFIQAEWSALAMVVNRVLLVLFFLVILILNARFFGTTTNEVEEKIK